MRGVKFIDVGFMQRAAVTSRHVRFFNAGNVITSTHTSPDEGKDYLDTIRLTSRPWYDASTGLPNSGLLNGSRILRDGAERPILNAKITTADQPWGQLGTDVLPAPSLRAVSTLLVDFNIYVAVHSGDTENHADSIYTQAAAGNWHFNGSGTFAAGNTKIWTPNGATDAGDAQFTDVTASPKLVPRATDNDTFNDHLQHPEQFADSPENTPWLST